MELKKIVDTSVFYPDTTGLKLRICASNAVPSLKPRVKFTGGGGTFSVCISDYPSVSSGNSDLYPSSIMKDIFKWVKVNKDALLKYWNDEIDSAELSAILRRI